MAVWNTSRLVRFANFARMACSLRSLRGVGCLISLPSLLIMGTARRAPTASPSFLTHHFSSWATTRVAPTRARHAVPLRPHPQGNHKGCPHALTPHSSLLTPHSSLLSPHSTPSFRACPGICLAVAACTLPPAPHGARARHAVPLRPHPQGNHKGCPYDLTPHKGTARRATTA